MHHHSYLDRLTLIYVIHTIALLMPTEKINYELILFFTFLDSFIDPPVLSFVQFRMHHLFLVAWKSPIPNRFLNHYNITIVPAQVNAINNIVTSDASVILKLNNQTLYNITVGATICSDLVVHRMFTAGISPILFAIELCIIIHSPILFQENVLS